MSDFHRTFEVLTGNVPPSWQIRHYREHFAKGDLTHVIDLLTGLGKTMAMAIWPIGRAKNLSLQHRLLFVVNRRTVVDQAADLTIKVRVICNNSTLLPYLIAAK